MFGDSNGQIKLHVKQKFQFFFLLQATTKQMTLKFHFQIFVSIIIIFWYFLFHFKFIYSFFHSRSEKMWLWGVNRENLSYRHLNSCDWSSRLNVFMARLTYHPKYYLLDTIIFVIRKSRLNVLGNKIQTSKWTISFPFLFLFFSFLLISSKCISNILLSNNTKILCRHEIEYFVHKVIDIGFT